MGDAASAGAARFRAGVAPTIRRFGQRVPNAIALSPFVGQQWYFATIRAILLREEV